MPHFKPKTGVTNPGTAAQLRFVEWSASDKVTEAGASYFYDLTNATGTLIFTGLPNEEGNFDLDDSIISLNFEFDWNVGPPTPLSGGGDVNIDINGLAWPADAVAIVDAVIAAINGSASTIKASHITPTQILLVNSLQGSVGNLAVVEAVTNMTATGMVGGGVAGLLGEISSATRVERFRPVRVFNSDNAIHYVAFGDLSVQAPTDPTDGVPVPAGQFLIVSAGPNYYIRADSNKVYAYLAQDSEIVTNDTAPYPGNIPA